MQVEKANTCNKAKSSTGPTYEARMDRQEITTHQHKTKKAAIDNTYVNSNFFSQENDLCKICSAFPMANCGDPGKILTGHQLYMLCMEALMKIRAKRTYYEEIEDYINV